MIMSETNKYEVGFGSDATKDPRRIVFITRKTSAKVKGEVGPQLMSYPHLILREAIVFQVLTIILVVVALFWDAPLEQLANPLVTPNPAKAPWYFLGLQELLHCFPPVAAGVLIPTLVVLALVVIPYFEVNIQGEPLWAGNRPRRVQIFVVVCVVLFVFLVIYDAWTVLVPAVLVAGLALLPYFHPSSPSRFGQFLIARTLPWWVMTWFIAVALTLTVVGTFFRGPGWSWVWPWR
jgi:quinol-cytochrome oxidoreductase complex cytochrome b subunit